jgi:hypothetical protein
VADGSENSIFSLLAARYGIGPALQLFSLFSGQGNDFSKGLGATQLAGQGIQGLGYLTGNTGLQSLGGLGPYVPPAIGAASLGYNLYNIAGNPNLSTKQKVGAGAVNAGESLAALYGPQAPYVAAFLAAQAVGGQMEKSGSPQIRAGGRQILAPLLPVSGFLDVLSGSKSPRASFNNMITQMGQVPVIGKPLGGALRMFGLGTKPTEGHMFRSELEQIFGQLAPLKGLNAANYNMPAGGYGSFSPQAVTDAQKLGQILAAYAPTGKSAPDAYALQAENVLLNKYGNQMPDIMKQLLPLLSGKQATASQPGPTVPAPAGMAFGSPNLATMVKSLMAGQKRAA